MSVESREAFPGKSNAMNRRRGPLIIATVVLVCLLVVAGILIYFNRLNAHRVKQFKQSARENWAKISKLAQNVNESLAGVASPADLAAVTKAAGEMENFTVGMSRSLKHDPVPSGYKKLFSDQRAAVEALNSYLQKVGELTSKEDENLFEEERRILQRRGAKASSAVNKFLSNATFMRVNISSDFYQAAAALDKAWQAPGYADDAAVQAVYDAANAFLSADIKESNLEKVWSMVSATRKMALNKLGLPKEAVTGGWRTLWGDKIPVDYQLSRDSINFSNANTANIKAVAEFEGSPPTVATVRLVKEDGVWKVETYPFVGWN